jgi:hypothetical protein
MKTDQMLARLAAIDETLGIFGKIAGHATLKLALVNVGVVYETLAGHLVYKHPLRINTHTLNVLRTEEPI